MTSNSFAQSGSLHLSSCCTQNVYFLLFQLPSLIHLSLHSPLPPSFCQLAHVNFTFPYCFSRGKCLCFSLSQGPHFNTTTPLLFPNTHTTPTSYIISFAADTHRLPVCFSLSHFELTKMFLYIRIPNYPSVSKLAFNYTQRHIQVFVFEVGSCGTCLPAVCCPLGGFSCLTDR